MNPRGLTHRVGRGKNTTPRSKAPKQIGEPDRVDQTRTNERTNERTNGRTNDAAEDCAAALSANPENLKARYRRGWARCELGLLDGALEDVEHVLKNTPGQPAKDAVALKDRILKLQKESKPKSPSAKSPVSTREQRGT